MNVQKKIPSKTRKKRFYYSPPPIQTKYHFLHSGELKKPLVITIITLVSILFLSLLVLFGKQFVGKAYAGLQGASVDLILTPDNKIQVTANLGPLQASGVYFELTSSTQGFDLCSALGNLNQKVINRLWNQFYEKKCRNNKFIFADATLNHENFKAGEFVVAELSPDLAGLTELTLNLDPIDVYDASGRDLFPAGQAFRFALGCTAGETRACGTDIGQCAVGTQTCQQGGTWGNCQNEIRPVNEVCHNNQDDDCDGVADAAENSCQCAPQALALCLTQADCETAQGVWKPEAAVKCQAKTCSDELALCLTEAECITAGGIWADVAGGGKACRSCTNNAQCIIQPRTSCQNNRCVAPAPAIVPGEAAAPGGGGGGGGGGGRRCESLWSCGYWAICGPTHTQTRTCTDKNSCDPKKLTKAENRTCQPCDESWACSAWSACSAGLQTRSCLDEHGCGTAVKKPDEQQSCQLPAPAYTPPPAYYQPPAPVYTPPPVTPPPKLEAPQPFLSQLWQKYSTWLLAASAGLTLLLIIFFLFLHFHHPHAEISNLDQIKSWVKAELQKNTPKENLRQYLKQQTGWPDQELEKNFPELKLSSLPPSS